MAILRATPGRRQKTSLCPMPDRGLNSEGISEPLGPTFISLHLIRSSVVKAAVPAAYLLRCNRINIARAYCAHWVADAALTAMAIVGALMGAYLMLPTVNT